ncbi:MAG: carboxypeptidase-like regulatory domain-containing protein [Cyclobacteriaceae bacterium]|nr:carboxypeptidase-like regulatory domain-containing protein [Cyclobacteriaceae bacterium]
MLFLTSRFAQAQSLPKPTTEQVHVKGKINQQTNTTRKQLITGIVNSTEDGTPLPGVNVVLKGTVNGTVTDANGEFELQIAKLTGTEVLVFSFIGLKTIEYPLNNPQISQKMVVEMELDTAVLAGEVIMGGIGTRKISFRRLWWRIKGLF